MCTSENITTLKGLTCDLVKDILRQIRSHREQHSPTNEERFCIPEYLLEEALEYVSGALYPIYRICCAAAHPGLNVWERFGADGSTGPGRP